jgi:hypothetical protein
MREHLPRAIEKFSLPIREDRWYVTALRAFSRSSSFRQAEFDMMYGEGISREGDLLDLASEQGLVHKSGAWYSYQDNRIGQGRENAKKYLKEHPELELLLRRELGLNRVGIQAQPADPDPNNGWWDTEADDE